MQQNFNEFMSIKVWTEKHSFDQGDSFDYLKGKTLGGVLVKSINTKVSEAALDSFKGNVSAAQKRLPFFKGVKKAKMSESFGGIDKSKLASLTRIQKSKQEKTPMRMPRIRDIAIDLNELKKVDKIYIDTSSLMETPVKQFFEKANLILRNYNKKIIVLSVVMRELEEKAGSRDHKKQGKAETAINVLNSIMDEIEVSEEEDDNEKIADQAFMTIFHRYRHKCKMLLITQDLDLSKEILSINNSQAVRGEKCVVYKINDDGDLCE